MSSMKPDGSTYLVNNTHTIFSEVEPPEDAYDEGTLTPYFTLATVRKWLEEEITPPVYEAGILCPGGFEDTYRAMLAAKLQEIGNDT